VVRDSVLITGGVTSSAGVAGVEVFLDETQVTNGNRTSVSSIEFSGTWPLTDGFHVLRVVARDSNGKPSTLSVPFSSDSTPPTITFSFCTSFDDRARNPVPAYKVASSTIDWGKAPIADSGCSEQALQSDDENAYVFHEYSELAKFAATSSQFGFVPEEKGPVTTAQSALVFEASVWRNNAIVGNVARIAGRPGETTRLVALAADMFGDEIRDLSVDDHVELRLVAADNQGNEGKLTLKFVLDFLPSPLKIEPLSMAASPAEDVSSYTFSAGNVGSLLDPAAPLPLDMLVVQRFALTNVSDRQIGFKVPLKSGAKLDASYSEWVGFVAGEAISNGTDSDATLALTQGDLAPVAVKQHWNTCSNNQPQEHLRLSQLTYPVSVLVVSGGTSTCLDTNSLLTADPVMTTSSVWAVRVHTAGGALRFTTASGYYTINPSESLQVSIGFSKPIFQPRTGLACSLSYETWAYNSGFAPRQYSDFFVAVGYAPSALSLPFGVSLSPRTLFQYRPQDNGWTYSDLGWVDCSGVSCAQTGCRTANDQIVLQLQGGQHTDEYQNGYLNGQLAWMRTGYREWASFALSRFNQPYSLSVSGTAAVTSTSRLTTNTQAFEQTFNLPVEQFSVSHSTKSSQTRPGNTQAAIYTKGTLP
jgi:hypothetical protein